MKPPSVIKVFPKTMYCERLPKHGRKFVFCRQPTVGLTTPLLMDSMYSVLCGIKVLHIINC